MDPAPPRERRLDLDWLRIAAVWLLFPYHVGKIFDVAPFYHLKNDVLVPELGLLTGFVHQWHMRLLFFVAGWAALASLAARGPEVYRSERVRRLLVPFLAGSLLLCPFLRYAEFVHGVAIGYDGQPLAAGEVPSFFAWLPAFFTFGGFSWAHLWFLIYLFVFSLLYAPLFERWLARPGQWQPGSRAWAWAPIVPLALVQVTLRERWPGMQNLYDDWANFAFYSLFFVLGFLAARHPGYERLLHRESRWLGAAGLLAFGGMLLRWTGAWETPIALHRALSGVVAWGIVVWLLGFARAHWTTGAGRFAYLRETLLPVYVLHSPAVVLVAHFTVQTDWPVTAKIAVILAGSVALTLAVVHFVVRPLRPARLLLGMKTEDARPHRRAPLPAAGEV